MLRPRCCPTTVGLSGKERELDLVVTNGGARGVPYPDIGGPCIVFKPKPDPRLEPAVVACPIFKFEQNDMFDFLRELCRSNVF